MNASVVGVNSTKLGDVGVTVPLSVVVVLISEAEEVLSGADELLVKSPPTLSVVDGWFDNEVSVDVVARLSVDDETVVEVSEGSVVSGVVIPGVTLSVVVCSGTTLLTCSVVVIKEEVPSVVNFSSKTLTTCSVVLIGNEVGVVRSASSVTGVVVPSGCIIASVVVVAKPMIGECSVVTS